MGHSGVGRQVQYASFSHIESPLKEGQLLECHRAKDAIWAVEAEHALEIFNFRTAVSNFEFSTRHDVTGEGAALSKRVSPLECGRVAVGARRAASRIVAAVIAVGVVRHWPLGTGIVCAVSGAAKGAG